MILLLNICSIAIHILTYCIQAAYIVIAAIISSAAFVRCLSRLSALWTCSAEPARRLHRLGWPALLASSFTSLPFTLNRRSRIMSLQVNLSSPDIRSAYDQVLSGAADYLILTYEKASNDLKVQTVEQGSLDDALFDFSSGRIQYGFIRVVDPNSKLPKFVLINWCGEGVPESRKGLFTSHAATVAQYMKNYHVSINARREDDLDSKGIMKKVTDSSGSKYSAAGQSANTQVGGRIEPVGSSYKPIGTPDVRGMQSGAKAEPIQSVGTAYTPARNELAQLRSGNTPAAAAVPSPPPAPRAMPAAAAPSSTSSSFAPKVGGIVGASTPAPAPSRPADFSSSRPAVAPPASGPAKPDEDDRIKPVGTAYVPVSLGKPGKLGNRYPFGGTQQQSTPAAAPAPRAVSSGLTWSQRQEKAKKEKEEEEARSAKGAAIGAGAGVAMASVAGAGIAATRDEEEDAAPPPPPPPPMPSSNDESVSHVTNDMQSIKLEAPAPATSSSSKGLQAVAVYEYAAAEDNEISFAEGDTITGIEQVDEGWWSGIAPNGQEGLFPATCKCSFLLCCCLC
jgi:hypothetical protein